MTRDYGGSAHTCGLKQMYRHLLTGTQGAYEWRIDLYTQTLTPLVPSRQFARLSKEAYLWLRTEVPFINLPCAPCEIHDDVMRRHIILFVNLSLVFHDADSL